MKCHLPYVVARPSKHPKYFYFRYGVDSEGRGGALIPLPGRPGTREFCERYEQLLAEHNPKALQARRGEDVKGTLGWVIQQFCAEANKTTSPWVELKPATQAVYQRHFDWLREHFGDLLFASFDKQLIRRIRDLRKEYPSVANMTVDKLGQLWAWADEYANLVLPGKNPAQEVASLKYESAAAPAWTQELCSAFESCDHARMVTFYFLARYTGQRKGDCCNMRWTDFDGRRIQVVQEKDRHQIMGAGAHPLAQLPLKAAAGKRLYTNVAERWRISQNVGDQSCLLDHIRTRLFWLLAAWLAAPGRRIARRSWLQGAADHGDPRSSDREASYALRQAS